MDARQVTFADHGHVLTNANVWSPDGQWVVYDVRPDALGERFDGDRIERVNVRTGEVQVLYRAPGHAKVGVATYSPTHDRVVFIHGPTRPTPDWSYGPSHRQGVVVDCATPGVGRNLDARDLAPPFTPGALRGGSHVHVFGPDGDRVSFTYDDAVVPADVAARNVGVAVTGAAVRVPPGAHHHDGDGFSVLVTRTTPRPRPGSDDISRACEESWIGTNGYVRRDGTRQRRALAFQGHVATNDGRTISEVFVADLPDDLTRPGDGPLAGTATRLPAPPACVVQRRLTRTDRRRHPGLQGPRHWLKSSPDGSRVACLMRDDPGVVQLFTVRPADGVVEPITADAFGVASAFTWHPHGHAIAYVADGSVWDVDVRHKRSRRLTPRATDDAGPSPLACCYSPGGDAIAYLRPTPTGGRVRNQIWVVRADGPDTAPI